MKTVLITGVNGYIGSKVASDLLHRGYRVIGMDLNSGNLNYLSDNPKFIFFKADITRSKSFHNELKKTEILIHCAGLLHGGSKDLSRKNYNNININGTKNILSFLNKKRLKQVVFLSTVSVFGKHSQIMIPDEHTSPDPEDFYGVSKLEAENEVVRFADKNNIAFTIFRMVPVYGKGNMLNINKRIYLPGKSCFYKISSGKQKVSFCSVYNVVDTIAHSLNNKRYFNQIFILKDRKNYSINNIIGIFKNGYSQKYKPVIRIPLFLPRIVINLIGLIFPKKKNFYLYQLNKITADSIYSGKKLFSVKTQLKWDLKKTLSPDRLGSNRSFVYSVVKRILDIFVSFFILLAISPLFIILYPILKFTGEGEVFFYQERIGKSYKPFNLIKFATMLKDSPNSGTVTMKNDPRILPLGRFLRNTKINELPQILNVLKGDMSMVGFRPLTEEGFQHYPEDIKRIILQMKPGLTGLGSIIFFKEEDILFNSKKDKMTCYREDVIPLKGALEKWYFEHRNFLLDIKIIIATGLIILFKKSGFYMKWFPIEGILRKSSLRHYFKI